MSPVGAAAWRDGTIAARAELGAWQKETPVLRERPARLNLWQVVQMLRKSLPADMVLTNGAGNFATWAHRFWSYGGFRTQLAPTFGSMGYGVPAGIAARLALQHQGRLAAY